MLRCIVTTSLIVSYKVRLYLYAFMHIPRFHST
nr:MAG TPA: hypothetical protein [Caudoviricetes sp.]